MDRIQTSVRRMSCDAARQSTFIMRLAARFGADRQPSAGMTTKSTTRLARQIGVSRLAAARK